MTFADKSPFLYLVQCTCRSSYSQGLDLVFSCLRNLNRSVGGGVALSIPDEQVVVFYPGAGRNFENILYGFHKYHHNRITSMDSLLYDSCWHHHQDIRNSDNCNAEKHLLALIDVTFIIRNYIVRTCTKSFFVSQN